MGKFLAVVAVLIAVVMSAGALTMSTVALDNDRYTVKYTDAHQLAVLMPKLAKQHVEFETVQTEFEKIAKEVGYAQEQDDPEKPQDQGAPEKERQGQRSETDVEKVRKGLSYLSEGLKDTMKWMKDKFGDPHSMQDPESLQEAMMEFQEKIEKLKNLLQEFKKEFRQHDPDNSIQLEF